MPLTTFRCPNFSPTAGETHSPDHCVWTCPHQCAPTAVLHTIAHQNKWNEHRGDMISPSVLKGCPRKLVLSRRTDYSGTPQDQYHSTRGSLYHGFLECADMEDVQVEKRLYKRITFGPEAPYWLSGRMDFYDVRRRLLEDYKTLDTSGLEFIFNQGVKPEHVAQLSLYAYLMTGGRMKMGREMDPENDPIVEWPIENAIIHYLTMRQQLTSGRPFFYIVKSKYEPNWKRPFKFEVERKIIGQTKRKCPIWQVEIQIPPVKIMSTDEVEAYIADSAPNFVRGFRDERWMPPAPALYDEGRAWECEFCPNEVRKICKNYEDSHRLAAIESVPPPEAELELPF